MDKEPDCIHFIDMKALLMHFPSIANAGTTVSILRDLSAQANNLQSKLDNRKRIKLVIEEKE